MVGWEKVMPMFHWKPFLPAVSTQVSQLILLPQREKGWPRAKPPGCLQLCSARRGLQVILNVKWKFILEIVCFFKDAVKVKQTDLLFSTPFDAIADFARRTTGGGGRSRRDDSRDRDLRFVLYASLPLNLNSARSSVVMHLPNRILGDFFWVIWSLLCSFSLFWAKQFWVPLYLVEHSDFCLELSWISWISWTTSRHEMSVPNDVVGSVIGKRGSKINEIRQIRFRRFKTFK